MGMKRNRRRKKQISARRAKAKAAKTKKTTSSSGGGGGKGSGGGKKTTTTTKKTFKKISLKGLTGKERAQAMAKNRIGEGTARNPDKTIAQVKKENRESMFAAAAERHAKFKAERAAKEARKKNLSKKLKNFDAKSYLNRYADLKAAFGTDEAAARRHYIKHGFDENRDISAFKAPTTAPAGAFGISAVGKAQAEANKREVAQQKKSYEQNRLKAGEKFADDRVQKQVGAVKDVAGKTLKVAQGLGKVENYIRNNPLQSLKLGKAAGEDIGKLAGYAYNKDIAGKDYKQLLGGFADFVTRDRYDIDKLGKESFLSEANDYRKGAMEALSIARADDKLNAFANADPKKLADLGVKTYNMGMASSLAQVGGEMYGLPSNFKDQVAESKEGFQKNYLDKIKIGDYASTRAALSDFAANVGRDPDVGLIGRGIYQATEGEGGFKDRLLAAFQDGTQVDAEGNKIAASPSIKGLNKEQRGIMAVSYTHLTLPTT